MATSTNAAFIAQYSNEVKQLWAQNDTRLMDTLRVHKNVVGSTYNFHRMAAVVANTKSRDAAITALDPTATQVTATLADYYAGIYIDKLDELKTNANLRAEYAKAAVGAINRKVDDVIITELANAANTTATVAGGLTLAKILECVTYLNTNEVDPEKRVLVIGAKQISEALAIQQLTSSDYVQVQAILQAGVGSALGMKWIMSNRLPKVSANRTCFAFNGDSIGLAVGQDVTTEVNYIPERVAYLTNSYVSLGAKIIDDLGITKMTCVE
ncbi:phage capsid protein [Azonexus hydrophilus]|uniref:phage capsid protein n=1 Tax=Azonexus hydrophilus TaxID=418702 RepID=UPI0012FA6D06|nr:phage capsid protein [Azonexus hydrophilus]